MHTFDTDLFRFELTPSNLIITIKDATQQIDLSPTEALALSDFLGRRRREIRREQRRLERNPGGVSYHVIGYECLETRMHRFLYVSGRLTIIDLQRALETRFYPSDLLLLDNFMRAQRRSLENMPQDLEVPRQCFIHVLPFP